MGGIVYSKAAPVIENEVDRMLEEERQKEKFHRKVLMLGAGECGKSTVVKQIKMIWKANGYNPAKEKEILVGAIRKNCLEAIKTMLEAMQKLKIDLEDTSLNEVAGTFLTLPEDGTLTPELSVAVDKIWNDKGMVATFGRRQEFWNMDATGYYMNEVLRIGDEDYEMSDEDVVMTRVRTTGIVVTDIVDPHSPYVYSVVDVGGQRSERRKWINCFDSVNAIIFLEGLSGYNQVLFEDPTMNRMQESLILFESIAANPIFKDTPIFIFLNKKDLFEEMIPKYPLSVCFPEYAGEDGNIQQALEFITKKYEDIMHKIVPGKKVYVNVIAARVRMDMKVAFGEVKENLKKIYG